MANKVGSIHSVVNVVGLFLIVIIKRSILFHYHWTCLLWFTQ